MTIFTAYIDWTMQVDLCKKALERSACTEATRSSKNTSIGSELVHAREAKLAFAELEKY